MASRYEVENLGTLSAEWEGHYRKKMQGMAPKFTPVVMRADPGVVYLDAQMDQLQEMQKELMAGQRRNTKVLDEIKEQLVKLTEVLHSNTNNIQRQQKKIDDLQKEVRATQDAVVDAIADNASEDIISRAVDEILPSVGDMIQSSMDEGFSNNSTIELMQQQVAEIYRQMESGGLGRRTPRTSINALPGGSGGLNRPARMSLSEQRRQSINAGMGSIAPGGAVKKRNNDKNSNLGVFSAGSGGSGDRVRNPRRWPRHEWVNWLKTRVSLFKTLSEQEIGEVFDKADCYMVGRGVAVVEQGEPGESMFVLVQGALEVYISKPEVNRGVPLKVTVLAPGQFFGEMSLLTGDPRAATVSAPSVSTETCYVLEISKRGVAPVLTQRPNLTAVLSSVVAERQIQNLDSFKTADEEEQAKQRSTVLGRVMMRMRSMLGVRDSINSKKSAQEEDQAHDSASRRWVAERRASQVMSKGRSSMPSIT